MKNANSKLDNQGEIANANQLVFGDEGWNPEMTNAGTISGEGTTFIYAKLTNDGSITQGNLEVDEAAASLINNGTVNIADTILNLGTIDNNKDLNADAIGNGGLLNNNENANLNANTITNVADAIINNSRNTGIAIVLILDGGLGLLKITLIKVCKVHIMKNIRTPLHDQVRKNMGWSNTHNVFRFAIIQIVVNVIYLYLIKIGF